MKLNDIKPNIESSGELSEKFFSIGDTGMIFDILRNKMYSNPILAICREYSCNARDAHREVGKTDVPIHIHLPNSLEPFYKIKDFGPGISPDRMENIFIKYTASTKREDNIQTGGFGLGCKSAFSYSDTFSVITNFNGIQYNYSCFIDETKIGKLALFSESPTKEINGTEIIIPVKSSDFNAFRESTRQSMSHWDVRPVIKGDHLEWTYLTAIMESKDWFIVKPQEYYHRYDNIKIIIDGIEYSLDKQALTNNCELDIVNQINGILYIKFDIGELSLSASREQIYLDNPTKQKISMRINYISTEIIKKFNDKFDSLPNLWEANICFKKEVSLFNDLYKVKKNFSWKSNPLSHDYLTTKCYVFDFTKYKPSKKYFVDTNKADQEKISKSRQSSIKFIENSILYINDLPIQSLSPRHVKKIFDDNPNIKSVQVICPNDAFSIQMIHDTYHTDLMGAKLLSSVTQASTRKHTPAASRLLFFKFDPYHCTFRQVSYSSIEEDKNKKVLCQLNRDTDANFRTVRLVNKNIITNNILNSLLKPGLSFYGVDADLYKENKTKKEINNFQSIEDFIDKEIVNNKNINYVEIKFAKQADVLHLHHKILNNFDKLEKKITDKNSIFLKKIKLNNEIDALKNKNSYLLQLYESYKGEITQSEIDNFISNNPDYNLEKIDKEIENKYPLIAFLDYYNSEIIPHLANYINLIDSK